MNKNNLLVELLEVNIYLSRSELEVKPKRKSFILFNWKNIWFKVLMSEDETIVCFILNKVYRYFIENFIEKSKEIK